MMIRCMVVDDDKQDLNKVYSVLSVQLKQYENTFQIDRVDLSENIDYRQRYDLYVMDIDMPGLNGFAVARKIYDSCPDATIIFCSNHDDLVFDSFRLNAFYFVRKTFLKDDMAIAIDKFINKFNSVNAQYIYSINNTIRPLAVSGILYFESYGNDLHIHLADGKTITERKSLKKVRGEVNMDLFMECGQSYLINCMHISEITSSDVVLDDETIIPIPRRKLSEIKILYMNYLMKG